MNASVHPASECKQEGITLDNTEIWREIEGYPSYMVSTFGRVMSLNYHRTGKSKILKPAKESTGYFRLQLSLNGKVAYKLVNRLVAQAFIPHDDAQNQVNHINGYKTDNHIFNLEWDSPSQNQSHRFSVLKQNGSRTRLTDQDITDIFSLRKQGLTLREIASIIGCSNPQVSNILRGIRSNHIPVAYIQGSRVDAQSILANTIYDNELKLYRCAGQPS